jgi:hypothetical protein
MEKFEHTPYNVAFIALSWRPTRRFQRAEASGRGPSGCPSRASFGHDYISFIILIYVLTHQLRVEFVSTLPDNL